MDETMPELECWLPMVALFGLSLGSWGIVWARFGHKQERNRWGRFLSVGAIVFLGVSSGVAAFHRSEGLVPLGLAAGFLMIGLLWGEPNAPSYAER